VFDTALAWKKHKAMSKEAFIYQEANFKLLRLLEVNQKMKQRELSAAADLSLGKTNYCINAFLDKELIKVQNFESNKCKLAYAYLLKPVGIAEKAVLTLLFLKRKMEEYEALKAQIQPLMLVAAESGDVGLDP
jgi:EPS-associated MarR family transcriptional regulator